jgi:outer membrane protein OmpA-like peptidoglycan-associated protein/Tol biopolymer transport system component
MRWILGMLGMVGLVALGEAQPQKAEKHIRQGMELMSMEDYQNAMAEFEAAIQANPFSAEAYLQAAYCAYRLRQNRKAREYFQKAEQMQANFSPRYLVAYADVLQRLGEPAKARPFVERALSTLKPTDPMYSKLQVTLQQLKNAEKYMAQPLKIEIRNLGPQINSPYPDFAPVISADESILYFTSRRPGSTGNKVAPDGLYYEDIYVSENRNGQWTSARNVGAPLNSTTHDACIALSADGQTLFLFNSENGGDIFQSRLKGTRWLPPKNMGSPINSKYWEPSVCLSADERTLFFVSDRPGGLGGRDIYMCRRLPNGKWSAPINLGPPINTPYDEDGPFFHPDGKTLFYSSNGPNSMGGFDIFRTELRPDSTWAPPVNLGYPINTPGDDIYFVLSASGLHGYYASERDDSYGEKDIYLIDFSTLQVATKPTESKDEELNVSSEPASAPVFRPNLTLVTGIIYDSETQAPLEATITIIDNVRAETLAVLTSNAATGKYLISLPAGKNYGIAVTAPGYAFHSENFIVEESMGYREVRKDIGLNRYKAGTTIILRNIFFDFDKATLRPESKVELDRVYTILTQNPRMKVRIAGHTDNIGSEEYNQRLSEARAKAVYDYLISRGISADRLSYIGYGESRPIDTNETSEGRQNNRRVELEIIEN